MPAHESSTDTALPEAVASMGAALLKTLPSRRWVHDRSAAAWGDFASFESTDTGLPAPRTVDFAEMTA
ncbi:hypothetical protein IV500_05415 [Paeniglutamicibacter antarcticus]|uniref:Uncharacterized protein n=1 Tax=Arthrobacter terrae TaxID=2935737 RepID=A0A931CNY9_9MICC|nr:hypothetical protein [Arthrobacter terrae]MBG0738859.1 hypothetical protein [Arthrobacter terrae]